MTKLGSSSSIEDFIEFILFMRSSISESFFFFSSLLINFCISFTFIFIFSEKVSRLFNVDIAGYPYAINFATFEIEIFLSFFILGSIDIFIIFTAFGPSDFFSSSFKENENSSLII